jgi:uncharacterized membrane protein
MGKWLHDRPWIWIVVLLTFLVLSGFVVLVIAEMNRPEIVKEKRHSSRVEAVPQVSNPSWAVEPPVRKGRVV